ncbi:fluoride efflux transporter FluC [Ureibacillus sp. 179-F W5.1 NHS]|uniref:fluoride efflux transporter FluC n=1 Tax=unclassified Ureibacillus TaxID=2638520 RepID=UPI0031199CBD
MEWILVALGGGIGATLRYSTQLLIQQKKFPTFWATAIVNIIGSFLLGKTGSWTLFESTLLSFLTIGVLGGFTTFSTFAFDLVKMIDSKKWGKALFFTGINLLGGILFFWIGWNL